MSFKRLLDRERQKVADKAAADLSAITWLEKKLKELGLWQVMCENATGFSALQQYEWDYDDDLEDWDGRTYAGENYIQVYYGAVYVPAGVKPLVSNALLRANTEHTLNWQKDVALTHHKPQNSKVPFAFETWKTSFSVPNTWRDHQLHVMFYWVPEIGEQLTPTCSVKEIEEETQASKKMVVTSVCDLENGDG